MCIEFPILSTYPQNVDGLLITVFIYPHFTTKALLWEGIFSGILMHGVFLNGISLLN